MYKKFLEFFHEKELYALRSERFYNDVSMLDGTLMPSAQKAAILTKWLEECFNAGACSNDRANKFSWVSDNVKETIAYPSRFNSEIAPDTRLKWELPLLISTTAINSFISFEEAVDIAIEKDKSWNK